MSDIEKSLLLYKLYETSKEKWLAAQNQQWENAAKLRDTERQLINEIQITNFDRQRFQLGVGLLFSKEQVLEMYNYYDKQGKREIKLNKLLNNLEEN